MYENVLLKEEVQFLRKELENWKEVCKKQVERILHTLVEAADQLEGSSPTKEDEEVEKVVCPACGDIFSQPGYTFIVLASKTHKLAPAVEEGQEAPNAQLRREDEPEIGLILDMELEKAEELQPQSLELMDQPNKGNIEANQSVVTQEPTPS